MNEFINMERKTTSGKSKGHARTICKYESQHVSVYAVRLERTWAVRQDTELSEDEPRFCGVFPQLPTHYLHEEKVSRMMFQSVFELLKSLQKEKLAHNFAR